MRARRTLGRFIIGATLIGLSIAAADAADVTSGQDPAKAHRIGVLSGLAIPDTDPRLVALSAGLARRGYGRNVTYVQRSSNTQIDRLPQLVAELIAERVDVILTFGYPPALAAKLGTTSLPIVISGAGDPVATGLVASLARPGGNLTGMTEVATELSAKRLQLLKEVVPGMRRVAMLWNADDLGMTLRYKAAEDAARGLDVMVQALGVREPNDFEAAFAAMDREPPDGILLVADALTLLNRRRVIEFAAQRRLPTIFEGSRFVHDGGLMSYGPDQKELIEHIAGQVARILGGTKPAELPMEQPARFEFVINLKVARELGVNLPQALVARADEVVE